MKIESHTQHQSVHTAYFCLAVDPDHAKLTRAFDSWETNAAGERPIADIWLTMSPAVKNLSARLGAEAPTIGLARGLT